MKTLMFVFTKDGEISTWGEDVPNGIELAIPSDWGQFGVAKYVANNSQTGLVVRDGWVDPVAEPEA